MSITRTETTEAGNVSKEIKNFTGRAEYFTDVEGDENRKMVIHRIEKTSIDGEVVSTEKIPAPGRRISKTLAELKARDPINGITFQQVEDYLSELSDQLVQEKEAEDQAED